MNPYLKALQDKYEQLRASIEGLQTRAVDENRDLTDDELRSAKEMGEQAKTLATQIEDLTEIENRNRKVADLAASLITEDGDGDQGAAGDSKPADQTRGVKLGGATTRQRDPGHYTRSSEHSFFGDMYRSRQFGDQVASQRLVEHQRALSTTTNGAGVVPPNWLTSEYETLARQGRAAANAVRQIPLGDDPRPLTLPKQTGSAAVAEQASENTGVNESDPGYDSDVDTVAPKPLAGKQIVSRQMLDMASPAIDMLIFGDLIGDFNEKVESKVCTAILAAGPAALASGETADAAAVPPVFRFDDVTLDAAIAVRKARKAPASIAVMSVGRYGNFLKLKDGEGRPLIPNPGTGQAVNVVGVGSVAVDGIVHGLGIVATDGVPNDAKFAVARPSDVLLFESNLLRFRFEEQAGPESIVLGVWGYVATLVRQGGKCVQTVTVA